MRKGNILQFQGKTKPFLSTAAFALLGATFLLGVNPARLSAQAIPAAVPAARAPTPQWQIDAGGKMEFDVVSVKANHAGMPPSGPRPYSNVPLGPLDNFSPTGGLLTATNIPLLQYMVFAYKLTPDQIKSTLAQLPKWTTSENYDIQARASGNPTKDQFRLMMQALLADRFKLAIHFETRELPIFALVLDKPGKLGPQLQKHPEDSSCPEASVGNQTLNISPTVEGGFPEVCGVIAIVKPTVPGHIRVGARNVTLGTLTSSANVPLTGVDRPVFDKTGIKGNVDFVMEFSAQASGPLRPGGSFGSDDSGPSFLEAMKQQLGLKLEPDKGPVEVIVLDHVEQPTEN